MKHPFHQDTNVTLWSSCAQLVKWVPPWPILCMSWAQLVEKQRGVTCQQHPTATVTCFNYLESRWFRMEQQTFLAKVFPKQLLERNASMYRVDWKRKVQVFWQQTWWLPTNLLFLGEFHSLTEAKQNLRTFALEGLVQWTSIGIQWIACLRCALDFLFPGATEANRGFVYPNIADPDRKGSSFPRSNTGYKIQHRLLNSVGWCG